MGVEEQEHGRSQPAAVQEHLTCFIGQYNMGSRWTGAGGERSLACAVRRPGTEARKEQEQEGNKARLEQEQERGKSRSREQIHGCFDLRNPREGGREQTA